MRTLLLFSLVATVVLGGCSASSGEMSDPCPAPPTALDFQASPGSKDELAKTPPQVQDYGQELLGFEETLAERCVESAGLRWRVAERDGEAFALTKDYDPLRINVVVRDAIVAIVSVG